MFRSIASLAVIVLFQIFVIEGCGVQNEGDRMSKSERPQLKFINKGVMSKAALHDLMPVGWKHSNGFIGDLEVGKLTEKDILAHVFKFVGINRTSSYQTFNLLKISFVNKIVTYVNVVNAEDSYGAVCAEPNGLGTNKLPDFWVRVGPYSNVTLTAQIFAHDI